METETPNKEMALYTPSLAEYTEILFYRQTLLLSFVDKYGLDLVRSTEMDLYISRLAVYTEIHFTAHNECILFSLLPN